MRTGGRARRLAVALGLLAACGSEVSGPAGWRQPGALSISGWSGTIPQPAGAGGKVKWDRQPDVTDVVPPEVLEAPDTVAVGQAFEVVTYTVGQSGCWRADGQSTQSSGRVVVLKPYDAHSGSEVCTMVLGFLAHRSTLVLSEVGEWTLRVEGRRLRLGDEVWEEPISAERMVVVR